MNKRFHIRANSTRELGDLARTQALKDIAATKENKEPGYFPAEVHIRMSPENFFKCLPQIEIIRL